MSAAATTSRTDESLIRATRRDYRPVTSYSLPVIICPSCGLENPDGFRLCGMCGASLAPASAGREERKVVTVLFCDLVGFTSQAEQMDPEDVRALLRPYHDRVRAELE